MLATLSSYTMVGIKAVPAEVVVDGVRVRVVEPQTGRVLRSFRVSVRDSQGYARRGPPAGPFRVGMPCYEATSPRGSSRHPLIQGEFQGVPDTGEFQTPTNSGRRRESRGLTSGMNLILLSITGTMSTVFVLSLRGCVASSIHACLPSP
jgi:hypothetical protein